MHKPDTEKVPSFYRTYIDMVPGDKELLPLMVESRDNFLKFLDDVPAAKENFRYQDDKWSVKQVVGHICDSERIFSYRALRFGRGDMTDLPGFEQEDYAVSHNVTARPLADMKIEFTNVRNASIDLFNAFGEKELSRFGSANGFRIDVRTIGFIIVGHLLHHTKILKNFYLD